MSVLVRYQELGMTRQQYDDAGGRLEQGDFPPAGLEFHVLHGEEGSLRVSEVWASSEQQRAFNDDVLLPVLNEVGIQLSGPAEIIPVHELFQF
ncbi:MAG TPA: hypothetical protein VJN72_08810 [Gaiellales bacterium]|nr:hypothetical protein [Gaiellales bacterium]